jgi:hypothetical protein
MLQVLDNNATEDPEEPQKVLGNIIGTPVPAASS